MANKKENLFDMFPPISTDEWMAKINVDLKGADFNKKLVWRTNEGFNVMPFYRKEDLEGLPTLGTLPGEFPYVRGTRDNNDWLIRQQIQGATAEEVLANARHASDRGVESVGICLCGDLTPDQLPEILKGLDLKKTEVNVACCPGKAVEVAELMVAAIIEQEAATEFRGSIDFNPFKRLLKRGL